MASDLIKHITDATFEADVLKSATPVLVDFWAEWCGPCKMIAPILDELAPAYQGKVQIAKMNVDDNRAVPAQFGIRGIPTLMLFKGGELVATKVGAVGKPQLAAFIDENRTALRPALDKLNGVLAIVDNRKDRIQKAIKSLNQYALSLGEVLASGPFFKAYVVNLLPGQFVQPFIDAAFSDLGLDPNVLLPSERIDPPTGQPATPPLPMPFPRTGQGGKPRLTLPEAITGNPDDQQCGPDGIPLPGPGCYPYREPPPAPPAGGPPPGPPAPAPPGLASDPAPTPSPVYQPAPNEVPPSAGPSDTASQEPATAKGAQ